MHGVVWEEQKLSLTALAANANGSQWAKYIETGMRVKVLKWDTPSSAAEMISNARNKTNEAACLNHEWTTMLTLNKGVTAANAGLATDVVYN